MMKERYKICKNCKKEKKLNDYFNQKTGKFGKTSTCKKCNSIRTKLYIKTIGGVITKLYSHIKRRHKKYDSNNISFSKVEFKEWIINNKSFNNLYNNWVKSNYNLWLVPSIDRENDYAGYTLDNMTLMTWQQNFDKKNKDVKRGINNKISKKVYQYDLDNNFIKEYYSQSQASRETNIIVQNINKACDSINTAGGYKWYSKKINKDD